MTQLVQVYKSKRKDEMYLYVDRKGRPGSSA